MDIRINRFKVRYQGENYGPGSVIYGVEDELAKKLVAESYGTIEALPEKAATAEGEPAATSGTAEGLPSVDPKKTVK